VVSRAVAVVGAGLGGLSTAIRLSHAGYAVTIFEQGSQAGGKAGSRRIGGYRFDTGPSLATMPLVFAQLFAEAGERFEDHLRFLPLAPICTYFYPDGTVLNSYGDMAAFGAEIERCSEDSRVNLERYLAHCKRIYDHAAEMFLWRSLHEPSSYLRRGGLRLLWGLRHIDALRSMDAANRCFFQDPRLVQLFDRYATYNGSSPYRVPATLNIIPYVEYGMGGYAVEGGIYAIPAALEALARRQGVCFRLDTKVQRILARGGQVRGVLAGGREHPCDIVVSNVDVMSTYKELLADPEAPLARRYRSLEPSSSGLVFFWGMKDCFPSLGVNNIFFSGDYPAEFRDIFELGRCPGDPTVYVNITSKVTPTDAPPGGENWFVLVNAPYHRGQGWAAQGAAVRARVLQRLEAALGRPVEGAIEVEELMTPPDIEAATGSRFGSLYGISSNSPLAAFLRHPNRSRRYRGLYFCGGSVHPGGGMPLAILSGKIAADLVRSYQPVGPAHGSSESVGKADP
jgi:diapolycopene oxygenase